MRWTACGFPWWNILGRPSTAAKLSLAMPSLPAKKRKQQQDCFFRKKKKKEPVDHSQSRASDTRFSPQPAEARTRRPADVTFSGIPVCGQTREKEWLSQKHAQTFSPPHTDRQESEPLTAKSQKGDVLSAASRGERTQPFVCHSTSKPCK